MKSRVIPLKVFVDDFFNARTMHESRLRRARSPVLPDVPAASEAGVPGYEAVIWLGIMAPAGTPKAIVERLNTEIRKIVNSTEVKDAWARQGASPMSMSTDEFGKYIREDIANRLQSFRHPHRNRTCQSPRNSPS